MPSWTGFDNGSSSVSHDFQLNSELSGVIRKPARVARPFRNQRGPLSIVIDPEFISLRWLLEPIEIRMNQWGVARWIGLENRECRGRHFAFITRPDQNRSCQSRLSRAQRSFQRHDVA